METNQTEYSELDEMRGQMQDLKRTIESQKLINQQLMRQVMASKAVFIRHYSIFELYVMLPSIYLLFLLVKFQMETSWLFYIVTEAMCTVSICVDVYINRINEKDYVSMPLLELMTALIRRRKNRRIQTMVGLPLAVLWMVWYVVECYGFERLEGVWVGAVLGGLVGCLIGLKINDKAQRIDAEAIEEIRRMMD